MMRRGLTVEEIAKHFGVAKSTAHSRVQAMKQGAAPRPARAAAVAAEPSPESMPEDVPAGLPVEAYDDMIDRAKRNMQAAEDAENHSAAQGWARVELAAMTERRKAAPPPVADPNEHPDMLEAAKRARKRLHDLIETSPETGP